jgi:uncharacterized protein Smg (DUF494 family)
MYERVVEIILFLMNELRSKKQLSDVDVSMLSRNGYTQSEISTAFSWLFDRIAVGEEILPPQPGGSGSHRVLHDIERMVIAPEAYGYLLQFLHLGLLKGDDVEAVIERLMAAGLSSVGLAEMKSFVAGYLFGGEGGAKDGLMMPLGTNDTIH